MKIQLARLVLFAACGIACSQEPSPNAASGKGEPTAGLQTRDLDHFGEGLTEAVRIHEIVYQTRGTSNAQMVVTSEGNVVIDTGLPNQPRVQELLRAADDGPIVRASTAAGGCAFPPSSQEVRHRIQ